VKREEGLIYQKKKAREWRGNKERKREKGDEKEKKKGEKEGGKSEKYPPWNKS
jgi:hypothetical protein